MFLSQALASRSGQIWPFVFTCSLWCHTVMKNLSLENKTLSVVFNFSEFLLTELCVTLPVLSGWVCSSCCWGAVWETHKVWWWSYCSESCLMGCEVSRFPSCGPLGELSSTNVLKEQQFFHHTPWAFWVWFAKRKKILTASLQCRQRHSGKSSSL